MDVLTRPSWWRERLTGAASGWWQLLWPHRCCLCAQRGAAGMDLCPYCLDLGWRNTDACLRCAMPLWAQAQGQLPMQHGQDDAMEPATVCMACQSYPGALRAVHAAWLYAAPIDALVRRYKFSGDLAAGKVLSQLMAAHRPPWLGPDHVLVPVPLHRQRLRERGHDQARELARRLSRLAGVAWRDGLTRVVATAAQSSLPLEQRQRNLRKAFAASGPVPGKVVLIDDVMTSGATLEAAAFALHQGGAREVRAWVAARTP